MNKGEMHARLYEEYVRHCDRREDELLMREIDESLDWELDLLDERVHRRPRENDDRDRNTCCRD